MIPSSLSIFAGIPRILDMGAFELSSRNIQRRILEQNACPCALLDAFQAQAGLSLQAFVEYLVSILSLVFDSF